LPGVAESAFQKAKENLRPWEEVPVRADEGCEKVFLYSPHSPSRTVSALPEGEGYLLEHGFCDFAFGFAQNDLGGRYTAKIDSFRISETNHTEKPNIPTNKGSGALCIGF